MISILGNLLLKFVETYTKMFSSTSAAFQKECVQFCLNLFGQAPLLSQCWKNYLCIVLEDYRKIYLADLLAEEAATHS